MLYCKVLRVSMTAECESWTLCLHTRVQPSWMRVRHTRKHKQSCLFIKETNFTGTFPPPCRPCCRNSSPRLMIRSRLKRNLKKGKSADGNLAHMLINPNLQTQRETVTERWQPGGSYVHENTFKSPAARRVLNKSSCLTGWNTRAFDYLRPA